MGTKSPGVSQRCHLILKQCLAIKLMKSGHTPEDFWMYDSGYMIFQNFLAANAQCWWNGPLSAATLALKYAGHVSPGMLLVTGEPCALEVLRGAYARSVLKPPATYLIHSVGDIEDCIVTPIMQGQFTPLPEALCDVIMDMTADGQSATIDNIRSKLEVRFPHMTAPSASVVYDTLVQLMQEQKIYQTSKGYFILTPERRRSRSRPRSHHNQINNCNSINNSNNFNGINNYNTNDYLKYAEDLRIDNVAVNEPRTILMTNSEALHSLYGEISTERDGDLTHQCIQTNLADVICGGNPNDKILYPRTSKRRSSSFPTPRSLERGHSMRIFGSSKRLQRCSSTRSLSKTYVQAINTDSSSSEYQSTDSSSPKKGSLLSRLFRRNGRGNKTNSRLHQTYSAQFPPAEWFNSKAVHLHSVGTQTSDYDLPTVHTLSNSIFYDGSELSQRSLTLPRRHRRHLSSESTFLLSSRDASPLRRRSTVYGSGSLPRSTQSIPTTTTTTTPNNVHKNSNGSSLVVPTLRSNHHQQQQHQGNSSTRFNSINGQEGSNSSTRSNSKGVVNGNVGNTGNGSGNINGKYSTIQRYNGGTSNMNRHLHEQSPLFSRRSTHKTNITSKIDGTTGYRCLVSGPSSQEQLAKTNSPIYVGASGPSSIDSGRTSLTYRTSGHSSLDSQYSNGSTVTQTGPARSIITLNCSPRGSMRHQMLRTRQIDAMMDNLSINSPRINNNNNKTHNNNNKPAHSIKTGNCNVGTTDHISTSSNIGTSTNYDNTANVMGTTITHENLESSNNNLNKNPNNNYSSISTSASNNSITLKVTTSSNDGHNPLPNTKIVVQNSPIQSVITFENSKLADNANVYIFNNETTTNSHGQILRKTLSKQQYPITKSGSTINNVAVATTGVTEQINPKTKTTTTMYHHDQPTIEFNGDTNTIIPVIIKHNCDGNINEHNKTKDIDVDGKDNDSNNRSCTDSYDDQHDVVTLKKHLKKSNLNNTNLWHQINKSNCENNKCATDGTLIGTVPLSAMKMVERDLIYKKNNVLNNEEISSIYDEKCLIDSKLNFDVGNGGSMGNLCYLEKNLNETTMLCNRKSLNSNCELNNLRYESFKNLPTMTTMNLNKNDSKISTTTSSPIFHEQLSKERAKAILASSAVTTTNNSTALNRNQLVHILQKNNLGSEPNLSLKENNNYVSASEMTKSIDKECLLNRRFSIASVKETTMSATSAISAASANNSSEADDLFHFPSLSDLSFNFTSLAAQKILQGVSLNSIDTLVELNMAAAAAAAAAASMVDKPQNNQSTTLMTSAVTQPTSATNSNDYDML